MKVINFFFFHSTFENMYNQQNLFLFSDTIDPLDSWNIFHLLPQIIIFFTIKYTLVEKKR